MKTDIFAIRESIGKIVSMLTLQKIAVTQRGSSAYVEYHPTTGAIVGLNVPYLPDNASEDFIAAVQGFLDHEVGHVLFSDSSVLMDSRKHGVKVMNLANVLEDVFVERKMESRFRGSGSNLNSVRKFFIEKIALPQIEKALSEKDNKAAVATALVVGFRAWGGQVIAKDFITRPEIAALLDPVAKKLGAEILEKISLCDSSRDCLNLAIECVKKLKEVSEPVPESPKGSASDESETGPDDESETGPADESESGPKSESETGPKSESETGPKSESETGPDDESETGPDDESEAGPETESETESGEPSSPKSDTEALPDVEVKGKSGTSEDEDEDDSDPDEGAGEDDSDPDEGAEVSDPDKGAGDPDKGSEATEDPDGLDSDADFGAMKDFSGGVADALSDVAKGEIAKSKYKVFSTEWDKVEDAPLSRRGDTVKKLSDSVGGMVGVMQKSLERAMAAKTKSSWSSGKTRGRISPGSLFKTSVGDDRVFRQRFETKGIDTAVSLVVDCSGSMRGEKIILAGKTAYALSLVLERLKVAYEVVGFTSHSSYALSKSICEDGSGSDWARHEPLYIPVFKSFGGKLDSSAVSRLAHLTEDPGWLEQNVDGESVLLAARRLVKQSAQRRIMIVLSDGQPSCASGRGLGPHLISVVKYLQDQKIDVVGVGILDSSVKSYYPKYVVLNDLKDLPTKVMQELTKLLLQ